MTDEVTITNTAIYLQFCSFNVDNTKVFDSNKELLLSLINYCMDDIYIDGMSILGAKFRQNIFHLILGGSNM